MAAATILSTEGPYVVGNKRQVIIKLDSPANTNTVTVPLYSIEGAFITSCDATALAAADSLSVTDITGSVVTLGVIGTGRDCFLTCTGV